MNKYVINLDLHGGDFAPKSVLEGANIALSKNPSIQFKLHSTKEFQQQYSKKFSNIFQKSDWIQSDNSISPDMKPSEALKKDNRNSSMSNAISDLKGNVTLFLFHTINPKIIGVLSNEWGSNNVYNILF